MAKKCTVCDKPLTKEWADHLFETRPFNVRFMKVESCSQACQDRIPDRKDWEKLYAEGR